MDKRILITNDDGINAPALAHLERALGRMGRPVTVAPEREMSATSHSITLNRPLRYREVAPRRFAVDGTPADCVILARMRILGERPDLLVSGINRGKNVGDSVMYSGTVAAAVEGVLQGVPSIAISVEYSERMDYESAAEFAALLGRKVLAEGLPPDIILNVNFPSAWNGSVVLTRQGQREGKSVMVENLDGHGDEYAWLQQEIHPAAGISGGELPIDADVLHQGYASLTPLHLDRTSYRSIKPLSAWTDILDTKAFRH